MYNEIKDHTTAKERMDIAREHGVKSRAGLHYILTGKKHNGPLLEALLVRAEKNKIAREKEQHALQQRVKALGA